MPRGGEYRPPGTAARQCAVVPRPYGLHGWPSHELAALASAAQSRSGQQVPTPQDDDAARDAATVLVQPFGWSLADDAVRRSATGHDPGAVGAPARVHATSHDDDAAPDPSRNSRGHGSLDIAATSHLAARHAPSAACATDAAAKPSWGSDCQA